MGGVDLHQPDVLSVSKLCTMTPAQINRKVTKPLMERKRRQRINNSLSELKCLILGDSASPGGDCGGDGGVTDGAVTAGQGKLEKADILEMTVRYIRDQRRHVTSYPAAEDHRHGNRRVTSYPVADNHLSNNATSYPEQYHGNCRASPPPRDHHHDNRTAACHHEHVTSSPSPTSPAHGNHSNQFTSGYVQCAAEIYRFLSAGSDDILPPAATTAAGSGTGDGIRYKLERHLAAAVSGRLQLPPPAQQRRLYVDMSSGGSSGGSDGGSSCSGGSPSPPAPGHGPMWRPW